MAIVNVTYGGSQRPAKGRLYSYLDPKGTRRTGDEIVVKATSSRGKVFKTLATVRSTHGTGTRGEADTKQWMEEYGGVGLRTVTGGPQDQLPGYYLGWRKDAHAAYELEQQYKALPGMTADAFTRVKGLIKGMQNDSLQAFKRRKEKGVT